MLLVGAPGEIPWPFRIRRCLRVVLPSWSLIFVGRHCLSSSCWTFGSAGQGNVHGGMGRAAWNSQGGLGVHCPSTTLWWHRCHCLIIRRPSPVLGLGTTPPFSYVGDTRVSSHSLSYPTPFDGADNAPTYICVLLFGVHTFCFMSLWSACPRCWSSHQRFSSDGRF